MIRLHKSLVPDQLDIQDILQSKMVSNGVYVRELESVLANIHNVKHVVCFSNCTTAIGTLFYILQPKTVAMPSFTWISAKMILDAQKINLKFLDVDPKTWVVPLETQAENVFVDYFFLTSAFGNKPDVLIPEKTILDSAHCGGHSGFGNLALAEVISFSPMKTFTGIEGGAVLTNNDSLAMQLRAFQPILGRMAEINAKVAINNLSRRNEIFRWKEFVYKEYQAAFGAERMQTINEFSSLNEIGVLLPSAVIDKARNFMEVRQRYDPRFLGEHNFHSSETIDEEAQKLFDQMLVLPSYPGCDYQAVIQQLQEVINE